MNCRPALLTLVLLAILFAPAARCLGAATTRPAPDLWAADNRVVLVGNALVEQDRIAAYIDARLLRWNPDRPVTVRNLGWGGDAVTGAARTPGYQQPAGRDRLLKDAAELKPTLILVAYGTLESYDGDAGLPQFIQEYNALLDALTPISPKLVLLSPTFHESLGHPFPDPTSHNQALEKYTAAIATIAQRRSLPFVDLFHPLVQFKQSHPTVQLTSNGITLNDSGYWTVAAEIERQLGFHAPPCQLELAANGTIVSASSVHATATPGKDELLIQLGRDHLPAPALPPDLAKAGALPDDALVLKVNDLPPGHWTLSIDGTQSTTADEKAWAAGRSLPLDQPAAEDLRHAAIQSEGLFYRRSRPFNDHSRHWTYIDGDFALYDKDLAKLDQQIATLRRPATHQLKLARQP